MGLDGDRANPVLAAAGDNFALLLRWLRRLWRALLQALFHGRPGFDSPKNRPQPFSTGDYLQWDVVVFFGRVAQLLTAEHR